MFGNISETCRYQYGIRLVWVPRCHTFIVILRIELSKGFNGNPPHDGYKYNLYFLEDYIL